MLIIEHAVKTSATPEQIWCVWKDVESWKSWDDEIEFSQIDGPFEAGTGGRLKMTNSPLLKTHIAQCEPLRMYVFETKLFWAKYVSTSIINQIEDKTSVTFRSEIVGPLAFFYAFLIGRSIKEKTPREMREMLKKAVVV